MGWCWLNDSRDGMSCECVMRSRTARKDTLVLSDWCFVNVGKRNAVKVRQYPISQNECAILTASAWRYAHYAVLAVCQKSGSSSITTQRKVTESTSYDSSHGLSFFLVTILIADDFEDHLCCLKPFQLPYLGNFSVCLHVNQKAYVACNFNYLFENEELLKVTGEYTVNRNGAAEARWSRIVTTDHQ